MSTDWRDRRALNAINSTEAEGVALPTHSLRRPRNLAIADLEGPLNTSPWCQSAECGELPG